MHTVAPTQTEQAFRLLLAEFASAVERGPGTLVSTPADEAPRVPIIDVLTRSLGDPGHSMLCRVALALLWARDFDPDCAVLVHDLLAQFAGAQTAMLRERGAFDA